MTLHLIHTNPTPALSWHSALAGLQEAHRLADAAHRALIDCPVGETELLLERSAAWRFAEARVVAAAERERSERRKVVNRGR